MSTLLNRALALLALTMLSFGAHAAGGPELKSGVFDPPRQAPDFSLRGSDGSELKLSRYRGKVIALGFGYTTCPDICPTTLAELAEVRKKLGADAKDFQVVYVTVDPERDTPERLNTYVKGFDPAFIGATGTPDQLASVRTAYGIVAKKAPIEGTSSYLVHHSSFVYLIDGEGRIRAMSPYGRKVADVVSDVKALMKK